jgi:hypothetical protein
MGILSMEKEHSLDSIIDRVNLPFYICENYSNHSKTLKSV